ncbi:MAG: hypothetical protein H6573_20825 [Lewinellaceae bacterium]|nr:hypothetical protein [Lewinellaceae bacterium]
MYYITYNTDAFGINAEVADVHPNSVYPRRKKSYERGATLELLAVKCYRPSSDLVNYADKIKTDFDKDPPRCASEARKRIKQLTGLERGMSQVRKFVKHVLKFRYRKFRPLPGGFLPIKELSAKQAAFLEQELNPFSGQIPHEEWRMCFCRCGTPRKAFT